MPRYDPRRSKPWVARIRMYGRSTHLGSYRVREEALAQEEQMRGVYHQELVAEGLDTYHRRPRSHAR